jgi:hypothetical protein
MFVGKAKSLPKGSTFLVLNSRVGSGLTRHNYTLSERFAKDKYSNLLRSYVNYGRKKFYNTGPLERFVMNGGSCLFGVGEEKSLTTLAPWWRCYDVIGWRLGNGGGRRDVIGQAFFDVIVEAVGH